jgi:hypothetical protein
MACFCFAPIALQKQLCRISKKLPNRSLHFFQDTLINCLLTCPLYVL